jgi:hypothetical protein
MHNVLSIASLFAFTTLAAGLPSFYEGHNIERSECICSQPFGSWCGWDNMDYNGYGLDSWKKVG